jgi:hypothetical protein
MTGINILQQCPNYSEETIETIPSICGYCQSHNERREDKKTPIQRNCMGRMNE